MSELRAYFERWQRLEDERKALGDDLKELFSEAKGNGFAPKAMRIAFRSIVAAENESDGDRETAAQVELYVNEITGPRAHSAPAHTREISEQPETAKSSAGPSSSLSGNETEESPVATTMESDDVDCRSSGEQAEAPYHEQAVVPHHEPSGAETGSDVRTVAPHSRTKFRPHCQHPERCGSSDITKHCWSCQASIDAGRVLA